MSDRNALALLLILAYVIWRFVVRPTLPPDDE